MSKKWRHLSIAQKRQRAMHSKASRLRKRIREWQQGVGPKPRVNFIDQAVWTACAQTQTSPYNFLCAAPKPRDGNGYVEETKAEQEERIKRQNRERYVRSIQGRTHAKVKEISERAVDYGSACYVCKVLLKANDDVVQLAGYTRAHRSCVEGPLRSFYEQQEDDDG